MKGQWLGEYTGTNSGRIMVNVDEFLSYYRGVAYLRDNNPQLPGSAVAFQTVDKRNSCEIQVSGIFPIDPKTGLVSNWENVKQFYAHNVVLPTSATANITLDGDFLVLNWATNLGTTGACRLPRSKADQPSELVAVEKNWEEFKDYVATLEHRKYLFRGQTSQWRLRTAFHRAGRADLVRFLTEDIQTLHKQLSARTKHLFNLDIPNENGAFFNLVQHHGYPTPLLDWTYSPYVAAFFAYRGISNSKAAMADPAAKVRIHVFDQVQWKLDWNQVLVFLFTGEHLSIGEFMAIENERMIPQQAATTITNLDDIESYVKTKGQVNGKTYLTAIDLPVRERRKIIQELGYMGITASSLFPRLDGACEELKERNFEL
jgi:hypothetical protein